MRYLIKLILLLPKKYKILCFLIVLMAFLLSLSEVWILSSIKPFIESFSTINIKDLGENNLNNYKNNVFLGKSSKKSFENLFLPYQIILMNIFKYFSYLKEIFSL